MGELSERLYCLHCEEFYSDDQASFSELWNVQLCPKCNFPLLSEIDVEQLNEKFKVIEGEEK